MNDAPGLETCPFCGEELFVSKSGLAIHQGQSQSTCMIGSVGIPVDHRPSVDKWNTRTDHARDKRLRDETLREIRDRADEMQDAAHQIHKDGGSALALLVLSFCELIDADDSGEEK